MPHPCKARRGNPESVQGTSTLYKVEPWLCLLAPGYAQGPTPCTPSKPFLKHPSPDSQDVPLRPCPVLTSPGLSLRTLPSLSPHALRPHLLYRLHPRDPSVLGLMGEVWQIEGGGRNREGST